MLQELVQELMKEKKARRKGEQELMKETVLPHLGLQERQVDLQ